MNYDYKRGFTLIELLVVISIISLLSSIVFSSLSEAKYRSRNAHRIQELKQIQIALELYRNQYGQYPLSNSAYPSGNGWSTDCDYPNQFIIPELVSTGVFKGIKDPIACPIHDGYDYASNGTDYKLISHTEKPEGETINGLENFKDPADDFGYDLCTIDGPNEQHFAIYTTGGTCWQEGHPFP